MHLADPTSTAHIPSSISTSSESSSNEKPDKDVMSILLTSAEIIAQHILSHLPPSSASSAGAEPRKPLFVGLQGPQGVGKTTLTQQLLSILTSSHSLKVAILSLDDIYLPHSGLVHVAQTHPQNGLLQGRGQPGTHDIELGESLFKQFIKNTEDVEVPVFDKSLFGGEGDRLPTGIIIKSPVDVVLFEGWSLGFYPLDQDQLKKRYQDVTSLTTIQVVPGEPDVPTIVKRHKVEDLLVVNEFLKSYVEKLYPFFDIFVKIGPSKETPFGPIYGWRLEQEHWMKSLNGGVGMSDEAVKLFVDRYIPGYVFFSEGVEKGYNTGDTHQDDGYPPWKGRLLRISVNISREVTSWEAS